MSRTSTEENIELHITPSADDILEVSPVNSFSHSHFSPGGGGGGGQSVSESVGSPTASLRHRRSQNNLDAFSSSSEGSSDDAEEEYDDTVNDARRQPPPSHAPGNLQQSPNKDDDEDDDDEQSQSSSVSPSQPQERKGGKARSTAPQSEFDKALLTGVPSRGYATSFFSADSTDSADAPSVEVYEQDALSAAAADPSTPSLQEQQPPPPSQTGSWDDATTEQPPASTSSSSSIKHQQHRQQQQHPPKKDKERKPHRVNITTTTQSSSASSAYPPNTSNNNNHNISSASSYSGTNKKPTNTTNASFDSGALLHTPNTTDPYGSDNIQDVSSGVLPDVLMTMRQKIESLQFFDSDMMKLASTDSRHMDEMAAETRESLKRSSQQSISAAVLVSLAHKRYERRRLAAMEIEKVVRSLVQQHELERVRAILLLLSDDYVRSTSEDARKGGVVALAACAIGLKKAHDNVATVMECRDLILASVVHACQDHSQRVRYYATESLFNVVKVIPGLAVQHFFILFEILRSLYADVDVDVRSGAELLDKKLKEVILVAVNSGSFSTDACVPVFARFVYMRNKATKRLTLSWLQELNEKLIGAPILEFLHLFLGGIFDMVADPSLAIRQSALAFLQSVLPKLLVVNSEAIDDMDDAGMKVDFDKILQSLVTTMEHPDPFVRKVAMFWMSRIVKAHMKELHASQASNGKQPSSNSSSPTMIMNPDGRLSPIRTSELSNDEGDEENDETEDGSEMDDHGENKKSSTVKSPQFSAASISVRNSLPHVLPGILLRCVRGCAWFCLTIFVVFRSNYSYGFFAYCSSPGPFLRPTALATLSMPRATLPKTLSFLTRRQMNSQSKRTLAYAMPYEETERATYNT